MSKNKVKTVSFFTISAINLKLMLIDKAVMILVVTLFLISLAFSLVLFSVSSDAQFIIYYNYYFLFITGVFWIIVSMRLVFLFLYSKMEDKTIYILSMQKISRRRIITSQLVMMFFFLSSIAFINFLIINILSLAINVGFNAIIFKATLMHLVYLILISSFLVCFFVLLSLLLKSQISTIIITLLLAFTFLGNLPYQFLTTSEKSKNLIFTNEYGNPIPANVSDVYKAFDLQKNIEDGNIKYKYLSKYINDFFVSNNFLTNNFSTYKQQRYDFWNNLNLINNQSFQINQEFRISELPTSFDTRSTGIKVGNNVNLFATFKYKFITFNELSTLVNNGYIEQNTLNVLRDLLNFSNDLFSKYSTSKEYQEKYQKFYGDLITIENGILKNVSPEAGNENKFYNYTTSDLAASYRNYFNPGTVSAIVFSTLYNSSELINFFEATLYDPLYIAISVLEKYFINYTSNYVLYTTNTINTSSDEWNEYWDSRKLYSLAYKINPIANLFSAYTYYAGESSEDIWFDASFDSFIDLKLQTNMFLGYTTYNLDLEKGEDNKNRIIKNTYNNFQKPWIFMIIQLAIAVINGAIATYIYMKKDMT